MTYLHRLLAVMINGGRGTGWLPKISHLSEPEQDGNHYWVYEATITFKKTGSGEKVEKRFPQMVQRLAAAGSNGQFNSNPWVVTSPPGYTGVAAEAKAENEKKNDLKKKGDEPKELGVYNLLPKNHFNRIFGREAHIRRILDAYRLADRTGFGKRTHSLLDGPPGCGKSDTMLSITRMLGEEGKAWLWFDATSMTKAGVIEELMTSAYVPPFLFIEEIEKCEEQSLRWLLGVMDVRGVIRRTNYRVGNQARNVRMVVTATANDVELLKRVMSGALYSRFQNKIYFPPPDREIMEQILYREIEEMKGKEAWIAPTLEFAFDKWGMTDPRDVITICSCGGDRLLNGAFQKDYEATMHPYEKRCLLRRLEKLNKKQQQKAQEKPCDK
jgi:hypothetical protein